MAATKEDSRPRIISLSSVDLSGLEDLFDEQCREWMDLLRWDYSGPSHIIREVSRQRDLPGVAAIDGGKVLGFGFYVVDEGRCSVGDIFVGSESRGMGIDREIGAAILHEVASRRRLRRIEVQSISIANDGLDALLVEEEFTRFERRFLMLDLEQQNAPLSVDSGIEIRPWRESDFHRGSQIIFESYRGATDSRINSQYRSEQGCGELLSILTDSLWCGEFLPEVSRVAVSSASGRIIGVLIGSRVAWEAGHISQISVDPRFQGLGVGRGLMSSAISGFRDRQFRSLSLAVTAANTRALRLYESFGFRPVHCFPVYYRDMK